MNKSIIILLLILLTILQYKLWLAPGGFGNTMYLKKQITKQQVLNTQLQKHNAKISENIKTLKESNVAIESRARKDLGMIKKGEMFYQSSN